jgi:hypothetical protein
LEHIKGELFGRLSYSPDPAPSDYRLFTYLKNSLGSQRFDIELMEGVKIWLISRAAHFFDTNIQKLIPQYMYFSPGGDYAKK